MIVLQEHQLPEILRQLERDRPKSLQLEAQIRCQVNKTFAWPGTEYVVDRLPDFSVIWSRPIKGSKEYVPRSRTPCVTAFCKDLAALAEISAQPDFVDWTQPVTFGGVDREGVSKLLADRAREHGDLLEEGDDEFGVGFSLDPDTMVTDDLPDGFHLGVLLPEHAEQVNAEWYYGVPESLPYFQFLLKSRFPSSAVFETSSNKLVAYVLYAGDGSLGSGFVSPDHRRRGLFSIVCRDAAKKVRAMGQDVVWVYVASGNQASTKAFAKMGATSLNWTQDWILYTPPQKSN